MASLGELGMACHAPTAPLFFRTFNANVQSCNYSPL